MAQFKNCRLCWTERLEEAEDLVLFTMSPWMMLKLPRKPCAIPKLMEGESGLTILSPNVLTHLPLEFTWDGQHIQEGEEVDVGTIEVVAVVMVDEIMMTTVEVVVVGDTTDTAENPHPTEKGAMITDVDLDPDLTHLDDIIIK